MSLVLLLVLMALVPTYSTAVKSVNISSGNELVDYLCGTNESMELYLDSSIDYTVSVNSSCVVDGRSVYSIVLRSAPSVAIVDCLHDQNTSNPIANFGIAFVNMTSVEISGVNFSYCGLQLKKFEGLNLNHLIATTRLSFSSIHSALFVFVNSSILFYKTAINYYYGFAVIGIDIVNANFTEFNVTHTSIIKSIGGTGVLVMYTKSINHTTSPALVVHGSTFYSNVGDSEENSIKKHCVTSYQTQGVVYNGAGLTVLVYDISNNGSVHISNTNFNRNFGINAGALLVVLMNASHFMVTIDRSVFKSNYGLSNCPGSALGFYVASQERYMNYLKAPVVSLSIVNSWFCDNDGFTDDDANKLSLLRTGAAYIEIIDPWFNVSINVHNVTFRKNAAVQFPSCLFVEVYGYILSYVHVSLQDLTVKENNQSVGSYITFDNGLFAFINVFKVELAGENTFEGNYATVFRLYRSPFYLNGKATFMNNTALAGAAINIKDSYLHINCDYSITLNGNKVENIGGALYVRNGSPDLCAVQFSSEHCGIVSTDNFAHNAGNIMYAFPIYNCSQTHWNVSYVGNTVNYTKQFLIINSEKRNNVLDVSTEVAKITIDGSDIKHLYPGEEFPIQISTLDETGNNVYSLVHLDLLKSIKAGRKFLKDDSFALQTETVQVIEETRNISSLSTLKVKFTTLHNKINTNNTLRLFLRPLNVYKSVKQSIILTIIDCPNGFSFIGNKGICGCSPAVNEYYKRFSLDGYCYITTGVIHIPSLLVHPWLGHLQIHIGNDTYNIFIIAYTCPVEFCRSREQYSSFKVTKGSESIELFNKSANPQTLSVCRDSRRGLLCGECDEGLSVVFGSGDCKKCSNSWLATIALYAVVGPVVIFLMFRFQLTLTGGTLNGIIFYAQMANVGVLQMLKLYSERNNPFASFLSIFLSLLNFDLGFPLCFYNGMNELWKTGLLLVFPLYLLSIAGFLIILSHHSSRLSNRIANSSVQVLTTVVHVSLSKLLITIIDVFTPVMLHYDSPENNTRVWYRNGNIAFSFQEQGLITLMAFTIVITSVFLVPYMCLLVGGKWLIRSSLGDKYFRSAYESIHAPFREKRRYWFLARFFLLITVYLIFAIFRRYNPFLMNVISLPLLIIFLFLQLHLRPFKNKFINILDSFVLVDLIVFYFLSWYINFNPQIDNVDKFMTSFGVLVLIIFLVFVGVVAYHVLLVTGALHRIVATWNIRTSKYRGFRRSLDASNEVSNSFYNSCGTQRETLFERT